MNYRVVIGTEKPVRLEFVERPQVGESVLLPDGRTATINQLVHDMVLRKVVLNCSTGKKK